MFCFTLLKLLVVVGGYWFLYYFIAINTCVKGWKVAHRIFPHKEEEFIVYIVFISRIIYLGLHCFVPCHYLLVLYLFISHLLVGFLDFFCFCEHFLQQSTCIVFISRVVGFALSCCLLLSSCSFPLLLFEFLIFLFL